MRKFGFEIDYVGDRAIVTEAISRLRKAVRLCEPLLKDLADEKADAGQVTLSNRHYAFAARYKFFSQQAESRYHTADAPPARRENVSADPLDFRLVTDSINQSLVCCA